MKRSILLQLLVDMKKAATQRCAAIASKPRRYRRAHGTRDAGPTLELRVPLVRHVHEQRYGGAPEML